jgi:hypothetical protein
MYFLIAAGTLLLASCSWNVADKASDLSNVKITTVTETGLSVEKSSVLHDGVLNSYEIKFIDDTTKRSVDQIQKYTSFGTLVSTRKFVRGADGRVTVAAYYNDSSSLYYFDVYTYDADGFVTGKYRYDASGSLVWAHLYAARASGTAKGQLESAASFDKAAVLDGGVRYYFIDTETYASKTWNMEASYGTKAGDVAGSAAAENPSAGAVNSTTLTAEAKLSLAAPAQPTIPSLTIPSDFTASSLSKAGYRFSFDDTYGNTTLSVGTDWYPTSGIRTDSRLGAALSAKLVRDSAGRITTQSTYYGSTLALKVDIVYDGTTWFPVSVTTTGAAMMLPLTYAIAYQPANHAVESITVKSENTPLVVLKYSYTTELPAQTAASVKDMDPFAFIGALVKSEAVIYHYKGDGKTLVESFTPVVSKDAGGTATGVEVKVNLPKADGTAGGDYNGSYVINYNAAGQCVSLQSKDKTGAVQWTQNTASVSAVWPALAGAAKGVADASVSFGPLLDSFLPAGVSSSTEASALTKGISDNFMYSMIF